MSLSDYQVYQVSVLCRADSKEMALLMAGHYLFVSKLPAILQGDGLVEPEGQLGVFDAGVVMKEPLLPGWKRAKS